MVVAVAEMVGEATAMAAASCKYRDMAGGIGEPKIADFAGEAMAADAGVLRDVAPAKRTALLACMVHVARTRARPSPTCRYPARQAHGHGNDIRDR